MPFKKGTRPSTAARKRNPTLHMRGALKKTSKRGAYKRVAKRNFQRRRAPFVETKSRTHEEMSQGSQVALPDPSIIADPTVYGRILNDDAFTHLKLYSFTSMTQGLSEMQMIGNSVYSRYLKLKVSFLYPNGDDMFDVPCNQYLVHGWVKSPMNLTNLTTPVAQNCNRMDIQHYVQQRLQPFFDERADKLRFIPKSNTGIKILGYKKIKNNKNAQFSTDGASVGPINMSCTWRTGRKISYEQGYPNPATYNSSSPLGPNDAFMFPNNSWLPFALIYNPQFASLPQGNDPAQKSVIQVAYNDCHWFSDS